VTDLLADDRRREAVSAAALTGSRRFAAAAVVPQVEAAYERVIAQDRRTA
jgi:hypothetical protein